MQLDLTEALGLVAGAIGSFAFLPQAVKIIRQASAKDVSATSYAMVATGASLWFVYGLLRGSPSIMLWNVVAGLIAAAVLVLKLRRPPPSA